MSISARISLFAAVAFSWLALPSLARADLVIGVGETLRGAYEINEHVVNHGHLAGVSEIERMSVGAGYVLSGAGFLENVDVFGSYQPGNSPAINNSTGLTFGGIVEIELGGTSPGFGSSNHDQINDSGTLTLLPSSALSVLPFNGFIPANGDVFTVFTWQTQLTGNFGTVVFDPFYAINGVNFTVNIINPTGTGSLVLNASVIPEASQILSGMVVCALMGLKCLKLSRRQRD